MKQYVMSRESMNESMIQYGIILIKGKPMGKHKEQKLYACHVNGWAEIRPGAVMLFLTDPFYRIIESEGTLIGIPINWNDEESLKAVLNFKSPGKISIVRNNNKTPYHWKTLRHTSLRLALNDVTFDVLRSGYVLESENQSVDIREIVKNDVLDTIFSGGTNVVLLDWTIPPSDYFDNEIDSYENRGKIDVDWSATFDCLYVGRPELDEQLEEAGLTRFETTFYFNSSVRFCQWYDRGSYNTPPGGETETELIETELVSIEIYDFEVDEVPSQLDKIIKDTEPASLNILMEKHQKFL